MTMPTVKANTFQTKDNFLISIYFLSLVANQRDLQNCPCMSVFFLVIKGTHIIALQRDLEFSFKILTCRPKVFFLVSLNCNGMSIETSLFLYHGSTFLKLFFNSELFAFFIFSFKMKEAKKKGVEHYRYGLQSLSLHLLVVWPELGRAG